MSQRDNSQPEGQIQLRSNHRRADIHRLPAPAIVAPSRDIQQRVP